MNSIYESIELLFTNELFSNVVTLVEESGCLGNEHDDNLNGWSRFQVFIYYAKSLYQLEEFKSAVDNYHSALSCKKLLKQKKSPKPELKNMMSENDIKYEMHLCYTKLRQYDDSFTILSSIHSKQRSPKVNMALSKLYQDKGNDRSAVTYYKEVLRECPVALDAAKGLLSLGMKGVEVHSLVLESNMGGLKSFGSDWATLWIRAHANMYARDWKLAIEDFRQLEEMCHFKNKIQINLGLCYQYYGDYINAMFYLEKAHLIEKLRGKGFDSYASLLYAAKRFTDLVNLYPKSLTDDLTPEEYVVTGYILLHLRSHSKALIMAQKACTKDPKSVVEALLLKGTVLFDMKRFSDAVVHFREVLTLAPWRYEPYESLINCYYELNRHRQAVTIGLSAYKNLPNSPQAITLYVSTIMKDPKDASLLESRAVPLLKKALAIDENYLPAVLLMSEIVKTENIQKAIEMLEKQTYIQTSCTLFYKLGCLYAELQDQEMTYDYYAKALNLDPNNRMVLDAIAELEISNANASGVTLENVKIKVESLDDTTSSYYNSNNSFGEDNENLNDTMAEESDHEV